MKLFSNPFFYLIIAFLLIEPFSLKSQSESEDKKTIENLLKDFGSAYVNLPQTKNKQNVLRFFNKDATSNIFVFNISGKSRVQNGDLKGFELYLDNILRSPGIELVYNIKDLTDIKIFGNLSTLVYRVEYETKVPDGIWVKGNEIVTMALEKKGGIWLIAHYTIMQVEDEKLKGTCLCELFISEEDDGEVVAKTTVPSGRSYSTKFDNFEFRTAEGDQVIKVKDQIYKRLKTGKVIAYEEDEEVEIGVSNSKKETVLMIIGDHLYKDSCARLKTKK
ncbi:MAG: hypothetical protein KDD63_03810 [Bacteroidetes bacterium]|nr:hypothetical protein [Bacteroidota bacterium]